MKTFIALDIETTGLDPETGAVLEIAACVVDGALEPVAPWFEAVYHWCSDCGPDMDPAALRMHRLSGLVDLCALDPGAGWDRGAGLAAYIRQYGAEDSPLFGSSVHFDRAWLVRRGPEAAALFGRRNVDVSSFVELAPVQAPNFKRGLHRAKADLEDSLNAGRWYRAAMERFPAFPYDGPPLVRSLAAELAVDELRALKALRACFWRADLAAAHLRANP